MEANELRIGNYVKHNSEWCYRGADTSVFQWSESDWYALGECTLSLDNTEPIPLTEDWLLSFGFSSGFSSDPQDCNASKVYKIVDFEIYQPDEEIQKFCNSINDEIKHVHQLQNLIFSLTGKELKKEN